MTPPAAGRIGHELRRAAVTAPTRDERRAAGEAAAAPRSRRPRAGWTAAPDRPDPVALLEEQATTRIPELVPVRYGRMAVSPFTFYRGAALPMAADLAAAPRTRHRRPAVRRRPPRQLRAVRLAGARPPLRHQRLRRDAARPVRVGPQAPGGQPRRRRPVARLRRARRPARRPSGRPLVPRPDGRLRRRCARSTSTTPSGRRRGDPGLRRQARAALSSRRRSSPTAPPRRAPRAAEADRGRRRAAADRGPPADHHRSLRSASPQPLADAALDGATARPSRRTVASCSIATSSSTTRSRWSASAASGSARSSPCSWAGPTTTRSSSRSSRPRHRCYERFLRTEPPGRATASASSPGSAGSRPRATSCSAGASGEMAVTGTSASSRTRRAAPSSRR